MSSVAPALSDIDERIVTVSRYLQVTRALFTHFPGGETFRACEDAESELNELLDRRFALREQPPQAA